MPTKEIYRIALVLMLIVCFVLGVCLLETSKEIKELNAKLTDLSKAHEIQKERTHVLEEQVMFYRKLAEDAKQTRKDKQPETNSADDIQHYTGGFLSLTEPIYSGASNHAIDGKK